MKVTSVKYVNARLGKPHTSSVNPHFLVPGQQIDVKARVFGETLEGDNEWFVSEDNEFFTKAGFHVTPEIHDLPFQNVPALFNALEIYKLWGISKGEQVSIGVIDNGVANHPALGNRVTELNPNLPVVPSVDNHGTTMACIIGANDRSNGKLGISPMVENIFSYAINIDALTPDKLTAALDLMLQNNVKIVNLSLCSNNEAFYKPNPQAVALQNKINQLTLSGCVIICATGNFHRRNLDFYPARYDNVISVAGYDNKGELDFDSNLWNGISVSMASEQHYFNDDQFSHSNGTSSAAAIISGCISCAYNNIQRPDKTTFLNNVFSGFPALQLKYNQSTISVPKFDTTLFLQSIKQQP